jgi:hypothetical protein
MPQYTGTLQSLQDQYNALTLAITSGVLKVKYADQEVEYQSVAAMKAAKADLAAEMNKMAGVQSSLRSQRTYASFNKGFRRGCGPFDINDRYGY